MLVLFLIAYSFKLCIAILVLDNVCKHFKVNDYSFNKLYQNDINVNEYYSIYIGVKIPFNFIREIYKNRDDKFTQYTCLVPRFMFENDISDYISYSVLSWFIKYKEICFNNY